MSDGIIISFDDILAHDSDPDVLPANVLEPAVVPGGLCLFWLCSRRDLNNKKFLWTVFGIVVNPEPDNAYKPPSEG